MCRRRFLFICILIAVSLLSFSNSLDFAGGSGSKDDPFLVSNSDQLHNIRNYLDKHYKQICDIDLSTYEDWDPIGSNTSQFVGTYNGNGYKITHLQMNKPTDKPKGDIIGLFGYISGNSKIENVCLENVSISARADVGGLVGYVYSGTINNCSVSGNIVADNNVGGLVGGNFTGIIELNRTDVTIQGKSHIGGLVGHNRGKIINNCASGDVQSDIYTGGLVGYNRGEIENCFSTGKVKGENFSGGLVGYNVGGIIKNCYFIGEVTGVSKIGGLVGENSLGGIIENCYSAGNVSGITYTGGLVGNNNSSKIENSFTCANTIGNNLVGEFVGVGSKAELGKTEPELMTKKDTFKDWDFLSIWSIEEAETFPYFKWQKEISHNYPLK
ncbi:MAG: GLUG motif-containing protein [Defluviitoga sp.]|jgi:hypothetical protein